MLNNSWTNYQSIVEFYDVNIFTVASLICQVNAQKGVSLGWLKRGGPELAHEAQHRAN